MASDAVEVVSERGTCIMVDVVVTNLWMQDGSASVHGDVIRDVIREYLLSSGCRRVYKGVDPRTLLIWALSFRGLVWIGHGKSLARRRYEFDSDSRETAWSQFPRIVWCRQLAQSLQNGHNPLVGTLVRRSWTDVRKNA